MGFTQHGLQWPHAFTKSKVLLQDMFLVAQQGDTTLLAALLNKGGKARINELSEQVSTHMLQPKSKAA